MNRQYAVSRPLVVGAVLEKAKNGQLSPKIQVEIKRFGPHSRLITPKMAIDLVDIDPVSGQKKVQPQ